MKKRKVVKKLEEKGIETVEELFNALEEAIRVAGVNVKKLNGDIEKLNGEIAFKQKRIEKNLLIEERGAEAIKILTGY